MNQDNSIPTGIIEKKNLIDAKVEQIRHLYQNETEGKLRNIAVRLIAQENNGSN